MAEPPAKKRKLPPLPDSFSTQTLETDSPSFHQGRIRAAPHVRGQWATHIYLELQPSSSLRRALHKVEPIAASATSATLHSFLSPTPSTSTSGAQKPGATGDEAKSSNMKVEEPLHLSLSRPLLLQTSQRMELRTAIASVARQTKGFSARFASFGVLENDERTRRFLGIEIGQGYEHLLALVEDLNLALEKMRLPNYYENPRFHASLVWSTSTSASTGGKDSPAPPTVQQGEEDTPAENQPPIAEEGSKEGLTTLPFGAETVEKLEDALGKRLREEEFYVAEVCLKIGKNLKRFPLA